MVIITFREQHYMQMGLFVCPLLCWLVCDYIVQRTATRADFATVTTAVCVCECVSEMTKAPQPPIIQFVVVVIIVVSRHTLLTL